MFHTTLIIFANFVNALLYAMLIAMFIRVLLSWIAPDEDSRVGEFLYMITEPFLTPVRNFLGRFEFFNNFPVDMSIVVFMLLISFVQLMLPVVGA